VSAPPQPGEVPPHLTRNHTSRYPASVEPQVWLDEGPLAFGRVASTPLRARVALRFAVIRAKPIV